MSAELKALHLRPIDRFHLAARMAEQGYIHRDPLILLGAARLMKTSGIIWQSPASIEDVAGSPGDAKSDRADARPDPDRLEEAIARLKQEGDDLLAEALQMYATTKTGPAMLSLSRVRIDARRAQSFQLTNVAAVCAAGDGAAAIGLSLTGPDGKVLTGPDSQTNLSLVCFRSMVNSATATIENLSDVTSEILLAWSA